jgi:hypothetical protein
MPLRAYVIFNERTRQFWNVTSGMWGDRSTATEFCEWSWADHISTHIGEFNDRDHATVLTLNVLEIDQRRFYTVL